MADDASDDDAGAGPVQRKESPGYGMLHDNSFQVPFQAAIDEVAHSYRENTLRGTFTQGQTDVIVLSKTNQRNPGDRAHLQW